MNLVRRNWTQDLTLALSVFAVVALVTGVTIVGLQWGNLAAEPSTEESVFVITDDNMDAHFSASERPVWNKLLYRITVVDFCGELTWHVREGYRMRPQSFAGTPTHLNRRRRSTAKQRNFAG